MSPELSSFPWANFYPVKAPVKTCHSESEMYHVVEDLGSHVYHILGLPEWDVTCATSLFISFAKHWWNLMLGQTCVSCEAEWQFSAFDSAVIITILRLKVVDCMDTFFIVVMIKLDNASKEFSMVSGSQSVNIAYYYHPGVLGLVTDSQVICQRLEGILQVMKKNCLSCNLKWDEESNHCLKHSSLNTFFPTCWEKQDLADCSV